MAVDADDVSGPAIVGLAENFAHGARVESHRHARGQLLHAIGGVMTVDVPDGAWVVPPERALWLPPNLVHGIRMSGPVAMRTLYLVPAVAQHLPATCHVVAVTPLLRALILDLVEGRAAQDEARRTLVTTLFLDELATLPALPLSCPMPADPRLRRVCRALAARPAARADLDACAALAGMSRRSFSRHFRDATGMSPDEWRSQNLALTGLERLAAGQSVTQVALDLGYASPGAFSAMMRRLVGEAPSRYFAREGAL
ncbi:AraC family transcriptional regulator [Zavarzinia sp. CC-PAN008]|uniref:AraC family transcriptional regulator n=1 Tax=Zavarzinia sp. CC-PAN008 TaxID=3243332 RepID=UPI003F74658C